MKKSILTLLSFILITTFAAAQDTGKADRKPIQFSGVVMTSDSLMAVPFASIYTKNGSMGTISDIKGFFTFAAYKGDTVVFSSVGFKNSMYVIPDTLDTDKYSMIKLLTMDTIELDPTIIRPIVNRALFDEFFVKLDVPDDDLERARKNLEKERMREEREEMGMDGVENQRYYQTQEARKFYYQGQVPPMNIFNPIAWAQFFEAWKRGDFKKK